MLITIISNLAQEASRSISENVTWGHRKRMADGKVSLPYSSFLGYKKGEDGLPEIVPEEAEIIRFIYRSFLEGMTTCGCFFVSKVWHSTSKYRRVIWQCNNEFKGQQLCSTPHLYEEEIKQSFVNAFSMFFQEKNLILETVQTLIESLSDTSAKVFYEKLMQKKVTERIKSDNFSSLFFSLKKLIHPLKLLTRTFGER